MIRELLNYNYSSYCQNIKFLKYFHWIFSEPQIEQAIYFIQIHTFLTAMRTNPTILNFAYFVKIIYNHIIILIFIVRLFCTIPIT